MIGEGYVLRSTERSFQGIHARLVYNRGIHLAVELRRSTIQRLDSHAGEFTALTSILHELQGAGFWAGGSPNVKLVDLGIEHVHAVLAVLRACAHEGGTGCDQPLDRLIDA